MDYFTPYLPTSGELVALLACVLVLLGFGALGGFLTGRRRLDGADLMAGWGTATGLLVILQWIMTPDLRAYAVLLGSAAAGAAVVQRGSLAANDLWRPAALLLPALVVACGVPLDEWDSFSHWGINTAWLWRYDTLPAPSLPVSPSSNPDYPYGFPLALYLASLLRGAYIDNAGAVINLLVLVAVAGVFARLAAGDDDERMRANPWMWSAWGALAAIVLNPGFVRSEVLASYADTAFGAALLFLCLSIWRYLSPGDEERGGLRIVGAVALALVALKEGGLFMLAVVALAAGILAVRSGPVRKRLAACLGALLPATGVALAWQWYVAGWLPSSFSILPFAEWRIDLLPSLLAAIGKEVADHGVFYALLAAVFVLGARGWWRDRDGADRFSALAALVVAGHLCSVMMAYLGASFTEAEVGRAASFHRYATQVGLTALAAVILPIGARLRSSQWKPARPWLPVTACAAVLLAGAPYLHRERGPVEAFYLSAGDEIASMLPGDATVGLLGWRREPYGYFLLRYALFRPGRELAGPALERLFREPAADATEYRRQLGRLARQEELSHLLVIGPRGLHRAGAPDMLLLARRGSRWESIGQWRKE